jgi:glycosyltransferase involved in cell wall biosynthesis
MSHSNGRKSPTTGKKNSSGPGSRAAASRARPRARHSTEGRLPDRRALICAPLPPEHDRESGSRRIQHMIEHLREAGWTVAFACENAPAGSPHLQHLRDKGIASYVGFGDDTRSLIEFGSFDLVIFAFWYMADQYASLVRERSPRTRIVVDSIDLHWIRDARRIFAGLDPRRPSLDERYGSEFVRELNAYAKADRVLTVSDKEAGLINDLVGRPDHAVPVPDSDEIPFGRTGFDDRKGILFVGNFRHPPNLDAVEYLCREVLPCLPEEIRADHPLMVVGNGLDGRVRDAVGQCDHTRLIGWVPSLIPYLHAARVSVVPLRFGAGTKRKVFQSLMAGTPVVATPVAVEGMDLIDEEHVLVGRDPGSLATCLKRLLLKPALWADLVEGGATRAAETHDARAAARRLVTAMEEVLSSPRSTTVAIEAATQSAVRRFQKSLASASPEEATVLVVSRGDPELVQIPGVHCAHFPQDPAGGFAGYHPRDCSWAIRHLGETLREGDCLAFPASSFWWLDHYPAFAAYLTAHLQKIWEDDDCILFRRPKESELQPDSATLSVRDGDQRVAAMSGEG